MIDTKELRILATCHEEDGNHHIAKDVRAAADELDRLYLDHAPLSREELETVLVENDWKPNKGHNGFFYKGTRVASVVRGLVVSGIDDIHDSVSIPLSAVTRATLRSCGVIK